MATTPLTHCHTCKAEIRLVQNPWTFHQRQRNSRGSKLADVVRFCSINCIASYYKLIPWPKGVPAQPPSEEPASAENS